MTSSASDNRDSDSQLSEVIAVYLQQVEASQRVDREQILAEHPDLAEALQEFFNDLDWMEDVADPVAPEADEDISVSRAIGPRELSRSPLIWPVKV